MNILFVVKDICIEHLGIMLFSSLLKPKGHKIDVARADYKTIFRKLNKKKYEIVAYSAPTLLYGFYLGINKQIKRDFNIYSVFGGAHPTFVPDIIQDNSIDCICRGEGEFAFLELVENISRGYPVRNIGNLWVKEDGYIYKNPLRPLIRDLDTLPFPDRGLFPNDEAFTKRKMHVITSRGCPYSCSYCSNPAYNNLYNNHPGLIRRRSARNIIEEIKQVKEKTSLRLVMFEDDLFIYSFEWLDDFCDLYKKQVGVPFFCYARADHINNKVAAILKNSGCVSISMGLETADDHLRNNILKRKMSKETIINAARIIKSYGIRLETTNVIGIPEGSLDADFETLRLNIRCRVDYSSVKLIMPYPGTEIRDLCDTKGLLSDIPLSSCRAYPFKSIDIKINRAAENLLKLFAITVEFPFMILLVRKMIYWPLGRVYALINLFWDGYVSFFRLYPIGFKGLFWGVRKYLGY
ncbi:MAG: B12-binding domain-containing radical SAM protein, partial [Candidatus Omnitrophica bacterium]|nr:B12-binding domain-containing radical SAM protein [Candidatus Omnitrophota bacterium]